MATADAEPNYGPRHFNPTVSPHLDTLVRRALSPDPSNRFEDGDALAEALQACPLTHHRLVAVSQATLPRLLPTWIRRWLLPVAVGVAVLSSGLYLAEHTQRTLVETRERPHDKELHKERNLVERFFNRLKHWRGLATRYEKTIESYLAMVHLICAKLWL